MKQKNEIKYLKTYLENMADVFQTPLMVVLFLFSHHGNDVLDYLTNAFAFPEMRQWN